MFSWNLCLHLPGHTHTGVVPLKSILPTLIPHSAAPMNLTFYIAGDSVHKPDLGKTAAKKEVAQLVQRSISASVINQSMHYKFN